MIALIRGGDRFSKLGVQVEWLYYLRYPIHPKNSDLRESHGSSCRKLEGPDPWNPARRRL